MNASQRWLADNRVIEDERGVTTIEYTMVVGLVSAISIYASLSLIELLKDSVALLAIRIAIYLTGFPPS